MKVLVFPHHLEIGGSQTNAIDLAAELRDRHGHDVVFFATPGPARRLIDDRGLRLIVAPEPHGHPSWSVARALARTIRSEQPDLVHAWDWPQSIDALYGIGLRELPWLCSEMSMSVIDAVPRHMPLTLGTEELVAEAARTRDGVTELIEPPVDTVANQPGAVDGDAFRREHDIPADALLVTIVSRLVGWLKQEGIERTITAVGRMAGDSPIRLAVVGDGTAAAALRERGAAVNAATGRETVLFTGALVDPRSAYAAADVVVGMGGSALRGMAFGKPLVVIGEQGFSEIFCAETAHLFYWAGYYGIGTGDADARALEAQLRELMENPPRREELGAYSLSIVDERYSLEAVGTKLDQLYRRTVDSTAPRGAVLSEMLRVAGRRGAGGLREVTQRATGGLRR